MFKVYEHTHSAPRLSLTRSLSYTPSLTRSHSCILSMIHSLSRALSLTHILNCSSYLISTISRRPPSLTQYRMLSFAHFMKVYHNVSCCAHHHPKIPRSLLEQTKFLQNLASSQAPTFFLSHFLILNRSPSICFVVHQASKKMN